MLARNLRLIFVGFLGLVSVVFSQNEIRKNRGHQTDRTRALVFAVGIFSYATVLDRNRAAEVYDGFAVPLGLGFRAVSDKRITNYGIGYQQVRMNKEGGEHIKTFIGLETPYVNDTYVEAYFNRMWRLARLKPDSKSNMYLGFDVTSTTHFFVYTQLQNSAMALYSFLDVGPKVELDYNFKVFQKELALRYTTVLPLGAFAMKPAYNIGTPDIKLFQPIGSYFRLNNTFFLDYVLSNGNKISLGYRWTYLDSQGETLYQRLQFTTNSLTLNFTFTLD